MRSGYLFSNDPRWITVRYAATCACCSRRIKPGERAFYWPLSRTLDCTGPDCGMKSAADTRAAIQDEQNMRGCL